jgi:hypothetical protein
MYAEVEPEAESDDDDWLAESGVAFAMQILRRQDEGIPDEAILSLSPFDQAVLTAIAVLGTPRWRHIENIVAAVRKLSGPEVPESTVVETLRSLEARYAVFSYSPDIKKYPDLGSKQYFFMTPMGERSLDASKKTSSGS